jgi:hypothetical protein
MIRNLGLGLVLVLGILWLGFSLKSSKKTIDWSPGYHIESKNPLGAYIFNAELKTLFPNTSIEYNHLPLYNLLKPKTTSGSLLFIIHHYTPNFTPDISKTDIEQLIHFAKQGNSVFIASNNICQDLKKNLDMDMEYDFLGSSRNQKHGFKLLDSALWGKNAYFMDNSHLDLNLSFSLKKNNSRVILGTDLNNKPNFVQYSLGKGFIFLHSDPEIFSNVFLLEKNNAEYLSSALSYIPSSVHTIYWDEYYQYNHPILSPLEYILTQPNLKMAVITGFLLFLFFATVQIKRRQRAVPILAPLQNKTLEFINTLGLLYFEKRDNKNLLIKILSQFREYIKLRFYLSPQEFTEDNLERIESKTGKDSAEILSLIQKIQVLEKKNVLSDQDLLDFNKQIQTFYT